MRDPRGAFLANLRVAVRQLISVSKRRNDRALVMRFDETLGFRRP